MLGFVALLIGGLAILYARDVTVSGEFVTIIATVTGAAMTNTSKITEAIASLLASRKDTK